MASRVFRGPGNWEGKGTVGAGNGGGRAGNASRVGDSPHQEEEDNTELSVSQVIVVGYWAPSSAKNSIAGNHGGMSLLQVDKEYFLFPLSTVPYSQL